MKFCNVRVKFLNTKTASPKLYILHLPKSQAAQQPPQPPEVHRVPEVPVREVGDCEGLPRQGPAQE